MSQALGRVTIGFTGHQRLTPLTEQLVSAAVAAILPSTGLFIGFCSLAEGSDQLFASAVLACGGELVSVIPCDHYETTFQDEHAVARYREYRAAELRQINIGMPQPSEEAFWLAGKRVVDETNSLIAVWDGKPAVGFGGTADVVRYARELGRVVVVVWPSGAERA